VVACLDLSLEVVGKSLQNQEQQDVWQQTEHALVKASDVTGFDEGLWAVLRVSYDRLTPTEKNIFLDVATFFSGNWNWNLRDAKAAWRVAYKTEVVRLQWKTWVDLSLVYDVNEDETIEVHEQLESLGRKRASDDRGVWDWSAGLPLLRKPYKPGEQVNCFLG
jgi:hypothetical protein